MQKAPNFNVALLKVLGERPIVFNPFFARMGGSIHSAIFLGQLLYWQSVVGNGEWFYKTSLEIEQETTLTRHQQDAAVQKWCDLGVLEYEVRGLPARRHFRVEPKYLLAAINSSGLRSKKIAIRKGGKTTVPYYD